MSYYNTTNETGDELLGFIGKAMNQAEVIIGIYQRAEHKSLTPSDVWKLWAEYTRLTQPPLTSIRRAISDLELNGKLIKTDLKKDGIYGRPEHFWRLPLTNL